MDQKTFEQGFWRLFGKYGEGGEEYLHLWSKLVLFFYGFSDPEELADEVLDRVIRKAAQEEIQNNLYYAMGVAWYVRLEALKKLQVVTSFDEIELEQREAVDTSDREIRLQILDECLEELPRDDRKLLLDYYAQEQAVDKIVRRRKLAGALGLSIPTLRVRVHRIRRVLAKKMKSKMERYEEPRGLRGNVLKEPRLSVKRRM